MNSQRFMAVGVAAAAILLSVTAVSANARPDNGYDKDRGPSIIGGQKASTKDHPWVIHTTQGGKSWCGGSLVTTTKVLTAKHCFDKPDPTQHTAVAGRDNINSGDGREVKVSAIWNHPDAAADITVLTLAEPLDYPLIPLAGPEDTALYAEGVVATVLGWGDTKDGAQKGSDDLLKVDVPIIGDEPCGQLYPGEFKTGSEVCAGLSEGGKDSCQGDSGGPLVTGGKLIGVVSWGEGCARPNKPGVYSKVAKWAEDIEAQLGT
jgi:secreted trypsin-like serine protease